MSDPDRRHGHERRELTSGADGERRASGEDRRSVVSDTDRMIEYLKKIPVFKGLTHDHYRKLLYICYHKTLPQDLFLFEHGDKPDAFFILLSGGIKILYHNSTFVTNIEPISLVGEIGFFIGKARETAAVTTAESKIIKITRTELYRLLSSDNSLSNRLLINVISELALKMDNYTRIIQDLRNTLGAETI